MTAPPPPLHPDGLAAAVSPVTGIVRQVIDFPVSPADPAVFTTLATPSRPDRLGGGMTARPGAGVGLTAEAARSSAVGEVLERYASSWIDPARLLFGRREELGRGRRLADPSAFALFHPEQYPREGTGTAAPGRVPPVPYAPFDDATPIAWTEGRSLLDGGATWVPAALTHLPYSRRRPDEALIASPTSSGLACAASLEEATLKALCEVIERDALMILWRNRLPLPRDHRFVERRLPDRLASRLARPHLAYTVVDMTTDLPVPARLCVLVDRSTSPPAIVVGAGAGLDGDAADLRCVLEAAHTLLWMRQQPPDRVRVPAIPDEIDSFEDHVAYYAFGDHGDAFDFLTGDAVEPPGRPSPPPTPTDLPGLVAALGDAGLEPIAVELTTEDVRSLGLHVVRVVIPGMQPIEGPHRHRFLGGRRLYEVPVRLGYRQTPPTIDDLDPRPHPLP